MAIYTIWTVRTRHRCVCRLQMNSPLGTHLIPQLTLPKDTIRQYNLHQSQLAFTIGYKMSAEEKYPSGILAETTVFSEPMVENLRKEQDEQAQSPTSQTSAEKPANQSTIYKYAPKSGSVQGGDEVLIAFREKLRTHKLGGTSDSRGFCEI